MSVQLLDPRCDSAWERQKEHRMESLVTNLETWMVPHTGDHPQQGERKGIPKELRLEEKLV